jgi:hypothetical protein
MPIAIFQHRLEEFASALHLLQHIKNTGFRLLPQPGTCTLVGAAVGRDKSVRLAGPIAANGRS